MVKVDQRQAMHDTGVHGVQFTGRQAQEMPTIEQARELVGGHQVFELAHHPAQRVLVRLQGKTPLAHALSRGLDIAGIQHQPHQHDEQHTDLQHRHGRVGQLEVIALPERDRTETEEHQQRATHKGPA
ncbi:hypothetical protein D3C79_963800 [compost metagenome]